MNSTTEQNALGESRFIIHERHLDKLRDLANPDLYLATEGTDGVVQLNLPSRYYFNGVATQAKGQRGT